MFLLSAGFSLIFGLMRIPNLTHGSLFMLGAYFGASFSSGGAVDFWLAALLGGAAGRADRRRDRALPAAPARRQRAGAGAGDARHLLHGRRSLPHGMDAAIRSRCRRRPRCAASRISAASPSRSTASRSSCIALVVAVALWLLLDAHAARRDDPRRRRRSRTWRASRHPRVAALHHRVLPRRGARGLRRHDRQRRSSRSIPGSMPRCCRWRSSS